MSKSIGTLEKVIGNFLDDPMRFVGMDVSDIFENLSPILSDSQKVKFWEAYENREEKEYQEYLSDIEKTDSNGISNLEGRV